jgi:hypothetical protein
MANEIRSVGPLRPDDLCENMFVVILSFVREIPRCTFCETESAPRNKAGELVQERTRVTTFAGEPLRVLAAALPHVLVERPSGQVLTLDLRQCHLGVLPARYAYLASKRLAASYATHGDPRRRKSDEDE